MAPTGKKWQWHGVRRGGRNRFNSRWLSDLFSYNTKLCSQDYNVKQSSFSQGIRVVLYSWKEQGLFKLTWRQELTLKNQSHLFPPSKCCPKCHSVLPAETSACTAREPITEQRQQKLPSKIYRLRGYLRHRRVYVYMKKGLFFRGINSLIQFITSFTHTPVQHNGRERQRKQVTRIRQP